MSAKYEPLKTITAYFMDENDKSVGDEDKYWILAMRGLEILHYNISAEPKTVRLPVNANQTVDFPEDYISWVKIGVLNGNGEVVTLKVNNALTTYKDNNPNRIEGLTADITNGWIDNPSAPYVNFFNNGNVETLYGVGGGMVTYGDCRIDEANNLIILNPNFAYPDLIVEYISSPERDTDFQVDKRLREPIIAFLNWKCKLASRQEFYAAAEEARRILQPIKMQSFNQTIRENQKFCLKL